MPKVYVPNNSGHDFSKAEDFGELVFITKGTIERFKINNMYRAVVDALEDSTPEDYIMVTGLTQINVVLTSVFSWKHSRLNLLIYDSKEERYILRELVIDNLVEKEDTTPLPEMTAEQRKEYEELKKQVDNWNKQEGEKDEAN